MLHLLNAVILLRRGKILYLGSNGTTRFGHVERNDEADYEKACTRLVVEGKMSVGRPRKTWQNTRSADMCLLKVNPRDVHDRKKWRATGRCKANTSSVWNTTQNEEEVNSKKLTPGVNSRKLTPGTSTTERNGGLQDGVRLTPAVSGTRLKMKKK